MKRLLALALAALPGAAAALDGSVHAFADLRAIAPDESRTWSEGGLGKTRWGGEGDAIVRVASAAVVGSVQLGPELLASAEAQLQPGDGPDLSLTEAWLRWRPVSTGRWRHSLKAGAFFPAISLENDAIGWTSRWTLTSSAINGWVGEELRTIGLEPRVEYRLGEQVIEGAAAAFLASDPAGELLAARGWALSDRVMGLGSRVREPDVFAQSIGRAAPLRYDPFQEIDDRVGWHAELGWRAPRLGRVSVMRYDNCADPSQASGGADSVFAWRTYFWSLGAQARIGPVELVAQAMEGDTKIAPSPYFRSTTHFQAAFLLAGWDLGAWRPAARVDAFGAREDPEPAAGAASEHGWAVTGALNYKPLDWLRLALEVLRIDSTRAQRTLGGEAARQVETQVQLAARLVY